MFERMLDKSHPPTAEAILETLGDENCGLLERLEAFLNTRYRLQRELRFPFGNRYGWGYKYSHQSSHLCYVFFEARAFTVTLQFGDARVPKIEKILPALSQKANDLWQRRYPCGEKGGWIHYRVLDRTDVDDVIALIQVKKKPA